MAASVTAFNMESKEVDLEADKAIQDAHARRMTWADEGSKPIRYDEPGTPELFDDPDNYDTDGELMPKEAA